MFKIFKLAPMIWMAWRWFRGQKNAGAFKSSRYTDRRTRR